MKYLLFLLFLQCFHLELSRAQPATTNDIASNKLKDGGKNVCNYTTTAYKRVNVSYTEQTLRTTYYITCVFDHFGCRTESRRQIVTVIKWRKEMRQVEVKNFYCCHGWEKKEDDSQACLKAICQVPCYNGGECITPNKCKCKTGFEGEYCQLVVDDCASKKLNDCEQVCTPLTPGHKCSCRHGWKLKDDKKRCEDINECKQKKPPCSCKVEDGVCKAICENLKGSYRCNCSHGYHLTSAQQCIDTDECYLDPDICDQICVNTPGSYECKCMKGYQLIGHKCVDINECEDHNGNCSHICKNIAGSYVCMCPSGFYLGKDRRTCIKIKPTMRNKVICQTDVRGELSCSGSEEKIMIIDAMYGRLTKEYCQYGNYTQVDCISKDSPLKSLQAVCDNKASCVITIDKKKFGDPCPGIEKYMEVTYDCMK